MKNEMKTKSFICFCLSYVFLSSVLKNVGMTMTCYGCDVMNIMWHKIQMAQEREKEREREGGGSDHISDTSLIHSFDFFRALIQY